MGGGQRRGGPLEEVSKVLKEMKDDIQRRLTAVLASREAYKAERRALDRQRDTRDYAYRLAFLRQVRRGGSWTLAPPVPPTEKQ